MVVRELRAFLMGWRRFSTWFKIYCKKKNLKTTLNVAKTEKKKKEVVKKGGGVFRVGVMRVKHKKNVHRSLYPKNEQTKLRGGEDREIGFPKKSWYVIYEQPHTTTFFFVLFFSQASFTSKTLLFFLIALCKNFSCLLVYLWKYTFNNFLLSSEQRKTFFACR